MDGFKHTVFCFFNKHSAIKRKYIRAIRANETSFTISTAQSHYEKIKLRNKFLKSKTFSDRRAYTSQRNFCQKLLQNTKRTYFNKKDTNKVTDNRTIWKIVLPLFSNNFSRNEQINLTKENEFISNDSKFSRAFNNFFQKQSRNWKFQVFQILSTMKIMAHLNKHSAISKITPVL